MIAFLSIAAILSLPVLAKAFGWLLFASVCDSVEVSFSPRLLLPVEAAVVGYLIFLLEGAQSSVMLANKQSSETLGQTLAGIDIAHRRRSRATRFLARSINHAPIDDFVVGRQFLIISLAFLFKFAFDTASLTQDYILALEQHALVCPLAYGVTRSAYRVMDHWLFSTLLCSILVAYVLQVPAKLMAQNHPMRFLTTIWLAIFCLPACRWIGVAPGLTIRALRQSGERRRLRKKFSYYSLEREHAPLDRNQAFTEQANLTQDCVTDLSVDLTQSHHDGADVWLVRLRAVCKVIVPSRTFGFLVHPSGVGPIDYSAAAYFDVEAVGYPSQQVDMVPISRTNGTSGQQEVEAHLTARFDREIPPSAHVVCPRSRCTILSGTPAARVPTPKAWRRPRGVARMP